MLIVIETGLCYINRTVPAHLIQFTCRANKQQYKFIAEATKHIVIQVNKHLIIQQVQYQSPIGLQYAFLQEKSLKLKAKETAVQADFHAHKFPLT